MFLGVFNVKKCPKYVKWKEKKKYIPNHKIIMTYMCVCVYDCVCYVEVYQEVNMFNSNSSECWELRKFLFFFMLFCVFQNSYHQIFYR